MATACGVSIVTLGDAHLQGLWALGRGEDILYTATLDGLRTCIATRYGGTGLQGEVHYN